MYVLLDKARFTVVTTLYKVSLLYNDRAAWIKMSISNTACSGHFSTDRTIQEYNADIWKLAI